ncbi:hypothetical protein HMPREF3037_02673 [Candidatus Stoquefichus sp. KLE1796]|nr:hypothetical protein HMPREF3037_02673 [Candidatus Stoquefichus sp. KLE1796]
MMMKNSNYNRRDINMRRNRTVYKIIIDNEKGITSIRKDELLTEMIEQLEDLTHDVDYLIRLLENKEEHLVKF